MNLIEVLQILKEEQRKEEQKWQIKNKLKKD